MGLLADIEESDFYVEMSKEDALGVVIRAAIYIENQLISLINETVASASAVERMNLDYDGRVNLAIALGLDEQFKPALSCLGSIRNRFAHRLNAGLGVAEANTLYSAFSPEAKGIVQQVYTRIRQQADRKMPSKFSALPPLDRFVLCVVTLRGGLIAARKQARATKI